MGKLLSVSEYAAKTGKDSGNLRKLIAQGRLPAMIREMQAFSSGSLTFPEKSSQTAPQRIAIVTDASRAVCP